MISVLCVGEVGADILMFVLLCLRTMSARQGKREREISSVFTYSQ